MQVRTYVLAFHLDN